MALYRNEAHRIHCIPHGHQRLAQKCRWHRDNGSYSASQASKISYLMLFVLVNKLNGFERITHVGVLLVVLGHIIIIYCMYIYIYNHRYISLFTIYIYIYTNYV